MPAAAAPLETLVALLTSTVEVVVTSPALSCSTSAKIVADSPSQRAEFAAPMALDEIAPLLQQAVTLEEASTFAALVWVTLPCV